MDAAVDTGSWGGGVAVASQAKGGGARGPAGRTRLPQELRTRLRRSRELTPQELGRMGEDVACLYLEAHGWEVLERNWTCVAGEADIVGRDGRGELALVEVKTRLVAAGWPAPEQAVDAEKQARYLRIGNEYLARTGAASLRFDVVAVSVHEGRMASVHHLVNAFGSGA